MTYLTAYDIWYEPIDHQAYRPLSLLTIEPIDHRAYRPSSLSSMKPIEPIDHRAYQPSSLSTIEHIDHRAYRPSSLSTIKPIDHRAYRPSSLSTIEPYRPLSRSTSGLLSRLLSLSACCLFIMSLEMFMEMKKTRIHVQSLGSRLHLLTWDVCWLTELNQWLGRRLIDIASLRKVAFW